MCYSGVSVIFFFFFFFLKARTSSQPVLSTGNCAAVWNLMGMDDRHKSACPKMIVEISILFWNEKWKWLNLSGPIHRVIVIKLLKLQYLGNAIRDDCEFEAEWQIKTTRKGRVILTFISSDKSNTTHSIFTQAYNQQRGFEPPTFHTQHWCTNLSTTRKT